MLTCDRCKMNEIREALVRLGITGDNLFDRIRDDLSRGLVREARTQLNFVDMIVNANAEAHASATKEPIA